MKCDLCGQKTDKNYFPDDFTILCADCAKNSGIIGGTIAKKYIEQKAKK